MGMEMAEDGGDGDAHRDGDGQENHLYSMFSSSREKAMKCCRVNGMHLTTIFKRQKAFMTVTTVCIVMTTSERWSPK